MKDKRTSLIIMAVLIVTALLLTFLNFDILLFVNGMEVKELLQYSHKAAIFFSITTIWGLAILFIGLNLSGENGLLRYMKRNARNAIIFGSILSAASAITAAVMWVRCLF